MMQYRNIGFVVVACCLSLLLGCATNSKTTPIIKYIDKWVAKVERVGNANYADLVGGARVYGALRLSVVITAHGSIEEIKVEQSSGNEIIDNAAIRIVELASPFTPFPPEVSQYVDILHISRTWIFSPQGKIKTAR